jgi:hypothetical protein
MGIRPIDFQILYSKTSDIEKLQQTQQQLDKIQPQQVAEELAIKKEIEKKQVLKTANAEHSRVEEKKEHEHQHHQQQQDESETGEKKKEKPSIDIRV